MAITRVETAICDRCGLHAPTTGGNAPPAWRWFSRSNSLEHHITYPLLICAACNKKFDTWFGISGPPKDL